MQKQVVRLFGRNNCTLTGNRSQFYVSRGPDVVEMSTRGGFKSLTAFPIRTESS